MFIPKRNEIVVYCSNGDSKFKKLVVKDIYLSFNGDNLSEVYYLLNASDFIIDGNMITYKGNNAGYGYESVTKGKTYEILGYDIMTEDSIFIDGIYIRPLSEYRIDIIDDILN